MDELLDRLFGVQPGIAFVLQGGINLLALITQQRINTQRVSFFGR